MSPGVKAGGAGLRRDTLGPPADPADLSIHLYVYKVTIYKVTR